MNSPYKNQSKKVADYYDTWNDRYKQVYGTSIQAHRPPSDDELISYTINSAGLQDGQHILDAGCGNCGPAVSLAKRLKIEIDALTISEKQVTDAQRQIAIHGMNDRIHVQLGDYHELDQIFSKNSFDKVLFLEALGHSGNPARVIEGAYKVLKPGGEIYIKDFYPKVVKDPVTQDKINRVVSNLNLHYSYNTMDLNSTIAALRENNFEIVFIKQIDFKNDAHIKNDFEEKFGIDLFGDIEEFYFAEWLEIKCFKPV